MCSREQRFYIFPKKYNGDIYRIDNSNNILLKWYTNFKIVKSLNQILSEKELLSVDVLYY